MLGFDIIGWRQIAPVERALLAIGLAQGDRELGLHELPTQIEGVAGLVDAQLGEDLLDVRPPDEDLVVEDRDGVPVGEDPEIGIFDFRMQPPKLGFVILEDHRILDGEEPVVDPLGKGAVGERVVHEPPCDVDLPHRAAGPVDDFGGQNRAYSGLFADRQQNRIDPGGIGTGQLGDVADSHQLRRRRDSADAPRHNAPATP